MINKKPKTSIWIFYGLTNISFWLSIILTSVFLLKISFYIFGLSIGDTSLKINLPNKFDLIEKGIFKTNSIPACVNITNATGELIFKEIPKSFYLFLSVSKLILFSASIFIFWFLKKFLANVKQGLIFDRQNIQYLKRIAYVMLSAWIFTVIIVSISDTFIISRIVFENIKFKFTIGSTDILYLALSIWVLSHIFQKGLDIETENNLTI